MTGRRVLVEISPRADQQIYELPEQLRVTVRLALLDLLDDPLPLAKGAIPFQAGGEEIPDAYEWNLGGVTVFYNIIDTGPLLQVIVQVVLIDAL
ncbi:hypothetical protein [Nocardia terpenica]|uniref:Type II toxin-antitoxin system RelE/ParE family toxin n=1 Tax=Nocardia terpenica TaxID=455432 RepID=A0A6G9ZFF6_9NOCA|nr:hypothetical protein [Nocardia terpenica]QIS23723.1 hypothetical protein F6W96_41025 [Nocardia terpenica]